MFSYYGSKSNIVHLYPPPKFDTVIEPFAGSARYALRYFDRDVILIDKYDKIIRIWQYLQQASEKDILDLPEFDSGETIVREDFPCIEASWLYGMLIAAAPNMPRLTVTPMRGRRYINIQKKNIAKQLYKIRHWKLINGEFDCLDNIEATWFIDPPYTVGGHRYRHPVKNINLPALGEWSQSRNGQVIVCENGTADWMPFMKLKKIHGTVATTTEVWWTNDDEPQQSVLF